MKLSKNAPKTSLKGDLRQMTDVDSDRKIRAFFAIEIPNQTTLDAVERYQVALQRSLGPLKLVHRHLMHITVRFLGNISLAEARTLYFFLQSDVNSRFFPQGEVQRGSFRGVGDFGKRAFFVKIEKVLPLLRQINHTIEAELKNFPTIKQETKAYKPHLTIARARRNRNSSPSLPKNPGQPLYSELKAQYRDHLFGEWDIARVVLKQSTLTPTGPIYSNLTFE